MSFETATSAPATRKNPLLFEIVLRGVVNRSARRRSHLFGDGDNDND